MVNHNTVSCNLGDIATVQAGCGFPKKYQGNITGDYPFFKVGDISKQVKVNNGYMLTADNYVSESDLIELKGKLFEVGSTLFAKIGEAVKLNRRGFLQKEGLADNNVMGVKGESVLNDKWIYYYLRTVDLSEASRSTTVPSIRKGDIETLPIELPPLAEQKVIAEKLDKLLAKVDSIKTRLDAVPDTLKRFRQSVLAAAVSGKLTEEWRGSTDYNVSGYPEAWTLKGLSDVGELGRGKSKHRPRNDPKLFGSEYPFIQTGEVANSNGMITSASKFYSEFGLKQSKLFPKGTLCITIAANIADTSVLGIDACFPDSIVGFTPDSASVDVLFVKYLIDVNKANLEAFAPATAQKNINLKVLNEMRLPFPSLKEQTEIVRRVEKLFVYADKVEAEVNAAQERVNKLTQSILAKAFRGELTAKWREQNPELISGDNSAEALLEKIKAEREKLKPKKKARARKKA